MNVRATDEGLDHGLIGTEFRHDSQFDLRVVGGQD